MHQILISLNQTLQLYVRHENKKKVEEIEFKISEVHNNLQAHLLLVRNYFFFEI